MVERIYNIFLLLLITAIVVAIALNAILEIGHDVQKSPYARFIAKNANAIYSFLIYYGVDVKNTILYLITFIVYLSFLVTILAMIKLLQKKSTNAILKLLICIIFAVTSLRLCNIVIKDPSKIFIGASTFNYFYLALVIFGLILVGLQFKNVSMNLNNEVKRSLFNFKSFAKRFLLSSIIGVIFLYIVEYIYLVIKFQESFISWQDYIYTLLGAVTIGFFTSSFYFLVFLIIFYCLYIIYNYTNIETYVFVASFFVSIFTIILIYYWGFNYIRNKTPIFNFIPPVSLMLVLYSFSIYPIAYIIFHILRNNNKMADNIMPVIIIATGMGWLLQLPIILIGKLFHKNTEKTIKLALFSSVVVCFLLMARIIMALSLEKYLSHAYVVHYVSGRYLVIISIFSTFLVLSFLQFFFPSLFGVLSTFKHRFNSWISLKLLIVYGIFAITGYILLGLRENVKFLIVRKSEIMSSGLKTLRYIVDFDRDEFSYLFYGGDKSEFDKNDNPYFKRFFKIDKSNGIKEDFFIPRNNQCVVNKQPNVLPEFNLIIVLLDGLRKDIVGIYGNTEGLTPHLDRFAKESIIFNNAYTNSSLSVVLFNIFYSGCYANKNLGREVFLPSMFDIFCKSNRFDNFIIPHLFKNSWLCPEKNVIYIDEFTTAKFQKLYNEYFRNSGVQFNSAIDLLDKIDRKSRFFLHIITLDTHFPFEKTMRGGKFFGYGMMNIYKNHVSYQDENFGMFVNELKRRNLYDKSIIVVFADHGSEMKEHGRVYHGYQLYSESVDIPFIIRIPGIKPKVIETPFSTVDFLPTILGIFSICDEKIAFDGMDFSGIVLGKMEEDGLKNDNIFMYDGLEDRYALLHKNRYKLIYNRSENVFELYDLKNDSRERRNLVDNKRDIFRKLKFTMFDFLYKGFDIYGDISIFKKSSEQHDVGK